MSTKQVTFDYISRPVADAKTCFIQIATEGYAFSEPTIHKFENERHAAIAAQALANILDAKVRLTYKLSVMEFGEPLKEYVSRLNGHYYTPQNQF